MQKSFDDLTITEDYMFCAVMVSINVRPCTLIDHEFFQRKTRCCLVLPPSVAVCKEFFEMVLADKIGPIADISYQKTFDQAGYAKGIRLDVWVTDSNGKVYDVEMSFSDRCLCLLENTSCAIRQNVAAA